MLSSCSLMQTAMAACVPGGKVVLVGMGQNHMKLAMGTASCREVDLLGSFRYANTVRPAYLRPDC